jgi:endonuclease/exonuclease/phosphatase (EEP) superfamily protein YafD
MDSLRIMSANLLVDRADPDDLRLVIDETNPDVIAVQELGPRSAEVIRSTHPHGHLDPRTDYFGLGIAARRPVDVERLHLPVRSGFVARLEPEMWPELEQPVEILDAHLLNPLDRPWRTTQNTRRQQIAEIRRRVGASGVPSVIVGDMNSTPMWPEYKLLTELGVDAPKATGTARNTWSQLVWGPRLMRIDHAFVRGMRPLTTSVRRIRGSDHYALITDVDPAR